MNEQIAAIEQELRLLRRKKRWQEFLLWLFTMMVLFLAGIVIFRSYVGFCIVEGVSMEPTLYDGDVVFFLHAPEELSRGEIVLISSGDKILVKRIIGIAGDTIDVSPEGYITRNGELLQETYAHYGLQDTNQWISFPCTVPEGEVLYIGDNREKSLDGRITGTVAIDDVWGKVFFTFRSLSS